jgi:antirestriction protein ArdC
MTDRITLPPRELFETAAEDAATTLHEISHSTRHEKRLARERITEVVPFGSPVCSREELVAELSAAFLSAEAGISNPVIQNQAAYVSGWLNRLRDDGKLIVYATAQAQRSAHYILNQSLTE